MQDGAWKCRSGCKHKGPAHRRQPHRPPQHLPHTHNPLYTPQLRHAHTASGVGEFVDSGSDRFCTTCQVGEPHLEGGPLQPVSSRCILSPTQTPRSNDNHDMAWTVHDDSVIIRL